MTRVAIVGAGVVGASVAWHACKAGASVVVLERAAGPGAGSTGRATGGFRAQYGTALNVRLSLLSRPELRAFREEVGADSGFREVGYLWLARSEAALDVLRAAQAVQHAEGLHEARMLTAADLHEVNPHVDVSGVIGAAWCPTDGVLRPLQILRGYLDGARGLGAEVRFDEPVIGLHREPSGRIRAAVTPRGRVEADVFVDAAGPWAAQVARLAGVDVPVEPLRRQIAQTVPQTALPESLPMTIWADDAFHVRVRDGRVLLVRPSPGNPDDPWDDRVEDDWVGPIEATARERVPALRDVPLDRAACVAGLYEMSPDRHALLGLVPGCANLVCANGSSGHGVMHSPALGLLAAEIALHGEARSMDVHALRPARFAEGQPIEGPTLL